MNFMQSIIEFEREHNVVLDICRDSHYRSMYKITFQRDRFYRSFRLPAEDLVGSIGEKIMKCQIEQFEKDYALSEGGRKPIIDAVIEKDLDILQMIKEVEKTILDEERIFGDRSKNQSASEGRDLASSK